MKRHDRGYGLFTTFHNTQYSEFRGVGDDRQETGVEYVRGIEAREIIINNYN